METVHIQDKAIFIKLECTGRSPGEYCVIIILMEVDETHCPHFPTLTNKKKRTKIREDPSSEWNLFCYGSVEACANYHLITYLRTPSPIRISQLPKIG